MASAGPHASGGREASLRAVRDGVTELIEPDRASLRLDPATVASVFLGLLFTQPITQPTRPSDGAGLKLTPGELVSVLLHGALRDPGSKGASDPGSKE
ncbi:MAG: hypothetical protein ACM3ML_01970 [Micromonosporaceae bacterium]